MGLFKRSKKVKRKTKVKTKRNFNFGRWLKGVFKRKPKEISPTPYPGKQSIATIFKNKIKPSKIKIDNIKQLDGICAKDLKKKFSVTGSKAKLLEQLVAEYKQGALSSSGLASKKDGKPLDKKKLNQMLETYGKESRKRDFKLAKKNANDLKKKFNLNKSDANKLDKVIEGFNKGKGSKLNLANTLFDSNKLSKTRLQKLIDRYHEGQKKKRGLSYMITQSVVGLLPSKLNIENLMEEIKGLQILHR